MSLAQGACTQATTAEEKPVVSCRLSMPRGRLRSYKTLGVKRGPAVVKHNQAPPRVSIITRIVTQDADPRVAVDQDGYYWMRVGQVPMSGSEGMILDMVANSWNVGVEELAWVAEHSLELRQYQGKWLALKGGALLAAEDSLLAAVQKARDQGVNEPYLTRIPKDGEVLVY